MLDDQGRAGRRLRVRGFPFSDAVLDFIAAHETVFVVEQNRDAQLRTLLMVEGGVDPAKLVAGPQLRRLADHRPLHHRRDFQRCAG
jgi:2-oxoglutarate ferredoxin oxidoreductase subunit alpha